MMKYIYLTAGLLLGALTSTSCSDFLNEYSQDMVVAKTVWHFDEVLLGNGYIKSSIVSGGPTIGRTGGIFNILDDDVNTGGVGYETTKNWGGCLQHIFGVYAWQQRIGCNYNASYYAADNATWEDLYARINVANIILDEIETVPHESDDDDYAYYRVKGETHFLRAYFYFTLANLYGDAYAPATAAEKLCVPLKLTPYIEHDKDKDTQFERASVKDVFEQVVKDLTAAEENLTRSPQLAAHKLHRASYESVELLFSRVYLYMQNWPMAEEKAENVLKTRGVTLSSIAALRSGSAFLTRENPEILFSQGCNFMSASDIFSASPGQFCVTRELRDLYDDNDARADCFFGIHSMSDSITMTSKYERGSIQNHISDCFLLRTAEAVLNKAEACAMQTGKEDEANRLLNDLRMHRIDKYTAQTYTGEELVKQIRDERRKELCFEGHRWFDLRRYAVCEKYPFSKRIFHTYHACGDAGVSYSDTYVLEEHDPAYTFALPEAVLEFDRVPMPDNPRGERDPLTKDDEPTGPDDPFAPKPDPDPDPEV